MSLHAIANVFTRGEASELICGQEDVYTMRQMSLHMVTNAFTRGDKQAYMCL